MASEGGHSLGIGQKSNPEKNVQFVGVAGPASAGAAARPASVTEGGVNKSLGVNDGECPKIIYDRDLTIHVELLGDEPVSVNELIKYSRLICGGVVACRAVGSKRYELTFSNAVGRDRLLDGFKIGNTTVQGRKIANDELVVSFLGLPAYVTDEEILAKLEGWKVSAVSPIKRRMWPGTSVADGTRFVKVKFNDSVQSLPYSAKFDTVTGPEFFRVIHDKQVKVCRICIRPGHIVRDCPEFLCNKCGVQGHYARECTSSVSKCSVCLHRMTDCSCLGGNEGGEASAESEEQLSDESDEDGMSEEQGSDESVEESSAMSEGHLSDSERNAPVSAAPCGASSAGGQSTVEKGVLGRQAAASSQEMSRGAGVSKGLLPASAAVPVKGGERHQNAAAASIRAGGAPAVSPASLLSVPVKGGVQHQNADAAPIRAGGAPAVGPASLLSVPVGGGAQRRGADSAPVRAREGVNLVSKGVSVERSASSSAQGESDLRGRVAGSVRETPVCLAQRLDGGANSGPGALIKDMVDEDMDDAAIAWAQRRTRSQVNRLKSKKNPA
uniref:CCHC-type domain-containing protein n=1 Tax=Oryzias latipes TaxID=8090 RepID=A0A3B3I081_ORYLA